MANVYHKHHHVRRQKKKKASPIDSLIYIAVIAGPLMTVPQISLIWIDGKTDVSLLSWAGYLFIAFAWLFYGIKHKDKPIIYVQLAWIVVDLAVVIGLLRS